MQNTKKRILAALLTAAMAVPMTVSTAKPLSVSAGEVLGETNFTYKIVPWQPVENIPAKQDFYIDEGALHITILKARGGEAERWDLRTQYSNLQFKAKHVYKVSFKAKARRAGMMLGSAIFNANHEEIFVLDGEDENGDKKGNMHMGPYMGGNWFRAPVELTTEYQTFEGTFIPTEDVNGAVWEFQYAAGTNYFGNAEDGDEIWFDDMSIECTTCDDCNADPNETYGLTDRGFSGLANNFISVNQLGYFPELAKTATLGDNGMALWGSDAKIALSGSYDYEIVDTVSQKVVFTGKTASAQYDKDSDDNVCKIDFSDFKTPGEYYIRIKGKEWRSVPFRIDNDIYSEDEHNLLTNALNYFYQNRSGSAIEQQYITSGNKSKLAHAAGNYETVGIVQTEWNNDLQYYTPDQIAEMGSSRINAKGGWFTGAGYDKSLIEGGMSLWTLQNMYEQSIQSNPDTNKFADGSGTVVVPETKNQVPDILDECKVELDYMAQMKVQATEKTWGNYAGLYYHGIKGYGFKPNMPDYEHEFHAVFSVQPPTFAATLNYAACAAQGARLWAPYDADYAAQLLKSAKEAYQAYLTNWYEADCTVTMHPYYGFECPKEEINKESLYAPPHLDDYGDIEVRDDAYWAACELYISASALGDKDANTYLKWMTSYEDAFTVKSRITGGNNESYEGSLTMLNCGNTAAAGSLSLALHTDLLDNKQQTALTDSITKTADSYLSTEAKQGYGIPYLYDGPGYVEPSGLSYIIPIGYEYKSNVMVLSNLMAMAYAYKLTGEQKYLSGTASGMDYLLGNNPMAFSFITGYGNYRAKNPANRYWLGSIDKTLPNAPDGVLVSGPNAQTTDNYMRALGFVLSTSQKPSQRWYADAVDASAVNSASSDANAALAWVVSFLQDEADNDHTKPFIMGDVNANGAFNTADAVLFRKWMQGTANTRLTNWKAADFTKDNKLSAVDLTLMKRALLGNQKPSYVEPELKVTCGSPLYVTAESLKLYAGPDETSQVFASIPKTTRLKEIGYQKNNNQWLFTEYEGQYGWIRTVAADNQTPTVEFEAMADKPVIYLYPETETDVHVELELTESELSTTYPRYQNGWDVTAYPDGSLLNKADGTHHKYLFWDSKNCRTHFDFSTGFCVAGSDTEQFLKEKLTYMGLTEEEMNEFIVYWLPRMEHNAYNLITFQGDAYTDSAKLDITPTPDSICRVFMVYVPLNEAVEIAPQQLDTFERTGFAVVEWGGSEIKG